MGADPDGTPDAKTPSALPAAASAAPEPTPPASPLGRMIEDEKKRQGSASITSVSSGRSLPAEPPSEDVVPDSPTASPGDEDAQQQQAQEVAVPPRYSIYTPWQKRFIVLGASIAAFISPLTGQIYLPALNVICSDLGITPSQVNLTVTTYMIFQGVTPMFVGGLADGAGRRPAYIICFVVYIAANIGLALSRNYASLLVVRCLQSAGSSSTVALCQAVVADIVSSAERGQYIGITIIPIVFAPSLGPVLGGVLSQYLGWRAIFWFLAILAAVLFVLLLFFLPETCRKIVGDGSIRPHPLHRTVLQLIQDARRKRRARRLQASRKTSRGSTESSDDGLERTTSAASAARPPLNIKVPNLLESARMAVQKEIGLLLVFSSLLFMGFYAIATAMPSQLTSYGLNELTIGLMYLPTAAGSIVAAFVVGPAINWNYRRHARRLGFPVDKTRQQDLSNFPIERARLETGAPLYLVATAVILCWGWALQRHAPLGVLCVLLFLNGLGMVGFNNAANALLVDITPGKAGAAVAANNLTRCLVGAAGTAVITPMINAIGDGWTFFIIGMLYLVASPGLLVIMRKGMQWRKELREKEQRRKERREAKEQQRRAAKGPSLG